MLPSPEIETPCPSVLGGEKGSRGGTKPDGRLADGIAKALKVYRALRYLVRSRGRVVLLREALAVIQQSGDSSLYPGDIFRTIDCMQKRHGYFVKVNHHLAFNAASYSGLVTCGSVWACAICAAKIQERRRGEIEQGMGAMAAAGFTPIMATFTFPHVRFDSLRDLLQRQALAFKFLRKGRQWDQLKKSIAFGGLIRSLETTHGQNGWHPHTHELWFVRDVNIAQLRCDLAKLWASACHRAGLLKDQFDPAFFCYSVDVRGDVDSGDYLAKQDDSRRWGMADEVAKASSKAGRAKGVHPHHFLVRGDPGDDRLYLEFVYAMKGKRQLFWSPGLKATCGIGDVEDETLAAEPEPGAVLLAAIPAPAWNYVVGNDALCEVLDAAELGGFDAVTDLLRSLGVPDRHLPLTARELIEGEETRLENAA